MEVEIRQAGLDPIVASVLRRLLPMLPQVP
jgi:hypothetical protein